MQLSENAITKKKMLKIKKAKKKKLQKLKHYLFWAKPKAHLNSSQANLANAYSVESTQSKYSKTKAKNTN